jgi:protein pelota
MKILTLNLKSNYVKLKIECPEDIWYLNQIIMPGDFIKGKTTRKIEKSGENERTKTVKKITLLLKIQVSKIEFIPESDSLRVLGTVVDDIEDIPKGSYHNIKIEPDSIIDLEKEKFMNYQIRYLKDAEKTKTQNVLLCAVDRETATLSLLKGHDYKILTNLEGEVEKKDKRNVKQGDFYLDLNKTLKLYDEKYKFEKIIIGSPGFWKDEILKAIDKELISKSIFINCSNGTEAGINEMLRLTELKKILKEERLRSEIETVEELLAEIGKNGNVVYGYNETAEAVVSGAVLKLLISNKLIKQMIEDNKFEELNRIMKLVEDTSGELHIINSDHEGGMKLDSLGSIGAILRYKIR